MKKLFRLSFLISLLFLFTCTNDDVIEINEASLKTLNKNAQILSDDGHKIKYDDGYEIIYDDFIAEKENTTFARVAANEGYAFENNILTAGTGEDIEIYGSGFGNIPGWINIGTSVIGQNTNIIGVIKTWTDTYIKIRVQSGSRSGNVTVTLADGITVLNVGYVTIKYSVYNWNKQVYPYWTPSRVQHSGNDQGQIVWHFVSDTYSTTLKENFIKGLAEWNSKTGINWVLGDDIPTKENMDGLHSVSTGYSPGAAHFGVRWEDCPDDPDSIYPYDMEIVFEESQSYTTILHELGHAGGLGHTAGVGGIMSPSGGSSIGAYDVEGMKDQVNYDISRVLGCVPNMIAEVQPTKYTYYLDNDKDGYGGSSTISVIETTPPSGYVTRGGDCNDNNPEINPGATDIPGDGIDQDCNGRDAKTKGKPGGGGGKPRR